MKIFYFSVALHEEDSVRYVVTVKSIDNCLNPCGQALKKMLGRHQSPQWEMNTSIQSLHHPIYCQCYRGSISVIIILTIFHELACRGNNLLAMTVYFSHDTSHVTLTHTVHCIPFS